MKPGNGARFIDGEISPGLSGRVDLSAYKSKNGLVLTAGGMRRRTGLRFIEAADGQVARLEYITRGKWSMVKAYLSDGSVRYFTVAAQDSNGSVAP